jgi:hypothetical protein
VWNTTIYIWGTEMEQNSLFTLSLRSNIYCIHMYWGMRCDVKHSCLNIHTQSNSINKFGKHEHSCASWDTLLTWPGPGRFFSYFPNWNHGSVAMHELARCHDGATRNCFSTTEVFFSGHFLSDVSALRDNTSDSLFTSDARIHDAQQPRCKKNPSTWF